MKIYFIGIGGIAVSGLSLIAKQKGNQVMGSDSSRSEITDQLAKKGIKVFLGHKQENLAKDADLVVYSEAVPESNNELKKARQLKLRCLSGAEYLAEIAKDYFLIAVSGMHGKTTTASMTAKLLLDNGFDPTYLIGTKGGSRVGKSKYLIIEADDYKAKLLNYHPDILLLTNIEEEHMDYFKDFSHIKKVFKQYASQVKGCIIANKDDKNVLQIAPKAIFFSLKDKEAGLLRGKMQARGEHNVSNALAVLKLAQVLKIPKAKALESLREYKGAWRRLEEKTIKGVKIISDYAHHPTEIKASWQAIKEKYPQKRILLVFQPHQYQRTYYLFDRFVQCFKNIASQAIITDIYTVKGRESASLKKKVSARKLVKAINQENIKYLPEKELLHFIKSNLANFDVIVIMTAGNIYQLAEELFHKSN